MNNFIKIYSARIREKRERSGASKSFAYFSYFSFSGGWQSTKTVWRWSKRWVTSSRIKIAMQLCSLYSLIDQNQRKKLIIKTNSCQLLPYLPPPIFRDASNFLA